MAAKRLKITKRLKIMVSDKDAHSADALYHQCCYNKFTRDYKSAESNGDFVLCTLVLVMVFGL